MIQKKELLGPLYREGKIDCKTHIEVFDHDYKHLSSGKIMPYGIFDISKNCGHISLGVSSETAGFICDSVEFWWKNYGRAHWAQAKEILILYDAGRANSYRHNLFKLALQKLANHIGLTLAIAHYPGFCCCFLTYWQ